MTGLRRLTSWFRRSGSYSRSSSSISIFKGSTGSSLIGATSTSGVGSWSISGSLTGGAIGVGAFISVEEPAAAVTGAVAAGPWLYAWISASNAGSVKAWRLATTRSVISDTGNCVKSTVARNEVVAAASFSCSSFGRFESEGSSDGVVEGC